jgi:hypothetical protein
MAIHDAYGRKTPYELLLPDPEWPERHFTGIEGEAQQRGSDLWNPAAFVMLGATGGALGEIRPDEASEEAVHDHGLLLFHAYHFWKGGLRLALVTAATLRELVEGEPTRPDSWAEGLAGGAGYVQLPQHLVWVEGDEEVGGEGSAPESVDGLFWAASPAGVFHVALATGIRAGRPGLSVVPIPAQPLSDLEAWTTAAAREGGGDFEARLPGADLDRLLGLRTPAEALKLAALTLGAVVDADAAAWTLEGDGGEGPPPTKLSHALI